MLSDRMKQVLTARMNKWSNRNIVDLLWRKHFNIPFGSKEHREADIFEQFMWYEEFKMIKKAEESLVSNATDSNGVKAHNIGSMVDVGPDTVSEVPMSQEEIDAAFENMDLSELNEQEKERVKNS